MSGDSSRARFDPLGSIARVGSWTALAVAGAGWVLGLGVLTGSIAYFTKASPTTIDELFWVLLVSLLLLLCGAGALLTALSAHFFGFLACLRALKAADSTTGQRISHAVALVLNVLGGGALAAAGAMLVFTVVTNA